jgi:hypothetical protein
MFPVETSPNFQIPGGGLRNRREFTEKEARGFRTSKFQE